MKNFENTLRQRKWSGVESTIRGDNTEMPVHTAAEKAIAHSHILNRCASLQTACAVEGGFGSPWSPKPTPGNTAVLACGRLINRDARLIVTSIQVATHNRTRMR